MPDNVSPNLALLAYARELVQVDPERAEPLLRTLAACEEELIRRSAAELLTRLPEGRASDADIVDMLSHEDDAVAVRGARVLAAKRDELGLDYFQAATDLLRRALKRRWTVDGECIYQDHEPVLSSGAFAGSGPASLTEHGTLLIALHEPLQSLVAEGPEGSRPVLDQLLRAPDAFAKRAVAPLLPSLLAIPAMRDYAVQALEELLASEQNMVTWAAWTQLRACYEAAPDQVRPLVEEALANPRSDGFQFALDIALAKGMQGTLYRVLTRIAPSLDWMALGRVLDAMAQDPGPDIRSAVAFIKSLIEYRKTAGERAHRLGADLVGAICGLIGRRGADPMGLLEAVATVESEDTAAAVAYALGEHRPALPKRRSLALLDQVAASAHWQVRAAVARVYGDLCADEPAVELDALPPDVLQDMIREAVERHWDKSQYERVMASEAEEQEKLAELVDGWEATSTCDGDA